MKSGNATFDPAGLETNSRYIDPNTKSGPAIMEMQEAGHKFKENVGVFDLSFKVPSGIIFGLLGPSGSGKTSTVRLLTGLYKPHRGSVRVLDETPHRFSSRARGNIGYIPQSFVLYPMLTVSENLNFVASLYGMAFLSKQRQLKKILSFVELYDVRHRLASRLSGGMQRRLQLACALVHDPQVIFADEPTTGIDPVIRGKFWDHFRSLRDEGRTLFITTQYVGEAEQCDVIGVMHAGHLLYIDTPEKLRRHTYGGDIIHLSVEPSKTLEAVELLNKQPTVQNVHRSNSESGSLLVTTHEATTDIPALVSLLQTRGIQIREAGQSIPPFDDVFIEFMKQQGNKNA
jgi:ABC-2 type transport system ATP-binding protein